MRFVGFRISEGNGSTSTDTATMLPATDLNSDNPSQLHPSDSEFFPTTEEVPKADPADSWDPAITYNERDRVKYDGVLYASLIDGNINNVPSVDPTKWELYGLTNYFLEVGTVISPAQTSSIFYSKEIGLFAEEYAIPQQWVATQQYVAFQDYIIYNTSTGFTYWKSIKSTPVTYDVSTTYSAGDEVFYLNGSWTSLVNGNLNITPGSDPTKWAPLSTTPNSDNGVFWAIVANAGTEEDPLVPTDGIPFLLYYIVRATNPIPVSPTHSTVYRITLGLTQQQADVTIPWFDRGDVQEFVETQLSFIEYSELTNREVRDLAKEVEALRESIPPTP